MGTVLARATTRLALSALVLLCAVDSLQNAVAEGDTRTLSFHNLHTGENITVTFKRDGRYVEPALKKLDWFMRDWRRQRETHMDPRLFDILWQVYREVGATQPIDVICGYRSPKTNAMLRARSGGVARLSQHILGKAIDFHIPGVPLAKVRAVGLKLQRGGVGFYPHSGSPFIHMDVGSVRHWPGISRVALLKIFPHGRTVHIPADGHPLPGYAQALAEIEQRGNVPNGRSLKAARAAGLITAHEEHVAELVGQGRYRTLIAMVKSGKGRDYGAPDEAPVPESNWTVVASLKRHRPLVRPDNVPLPTARPKLLALAAASSRPASAPAMKVAADNLFDRRGIWTGPAESGPDLSPEPDSPFELASADPVTTGSTSDTLAYAGGADTAPPLSPARRARAMGARLPKFIGSAQASTYASTYAGTGPAGAALSASAAPLYAAPMAIGGQRWDSPWLRATLLTPSVSAFMTMTHMGRTDPHWLRMLLHKPARMVVMTFAADPQDGMVTDHFTGPAVVFLATARFTRTQTASLW